MTDTIADTGSAPPSISDAAERRDGPAYEPGDKGVRQAAEDLRRKREEDEARHAVDPAFVEELERALPEAAARQKARADEQEFAEGWERGAKLREKPAWTLKEATDVRIGKRELARQLAEEDLTNAI